LNRSITYGLEVAYAGMICLAIALNLLPVFLITLSLDFGGPGGLTHEQLGRLAAVTFTRLRHLVRKPYFLLSLAVIFLGGATEVGLAQWLPAYAEKSLGYSKWVSGMSLLVFSVAMAIGRISVGLVGNRVNPFTLLLACCWSSVVLFIVGCFAPWPDVALMACMAVGVTGSCLWPSTLGVAADRFPSWRRVNVWPVGGFW